MSSTTVPNPANGSFPSRSSRLNAGWLPLKDLGASLYNLRHNYCFVPLTFVFEQLCLVAGDRCPLFHKPCAEERVDDSWVEILPLAKFLAVQGSSIGDLVTQ